MSLHSILLFLHIVGALGLFSALALEWAALLNLRRAAAPGQAGDWVLLLTSLRKIGGPSMGVLLLTGIYMMATRWGGQGWIAVGFGAMVVVAALGGALSGRRIGAIARGVPGSLSDRVRDPVLLVSAWLRTALVLGIVFIMATKPGAAGALTAMGVALLLGLAAAFPAWAGGRAAPAPARSE